MKDKYVLFRGIRFVIALDLIKCLKKIKYQKCLLTCAPISPQIKYHALLCYPPMFGIGCKKWFSQWCLTYRSGSDLVGNIRILPLKRYVPVFLHILSSSLIWIIFFPLSSLLENGKISFHAFWFVSEINSSQILLQDILIHTEVTSQILLSLTY